MLKCYRSRLPGHVLMGAIALVIAVAPDLTAQEATGYRVPDQVLVDIVDAPPTPSVSLGPGSEWLLLLQRPSLPPIAELAERELRLAGMRMAPRTNGRSRTSPSTGLALLRMEDGDPLEVTGLPESPRIENVRWSPDGNRIAFTHTAEGGIELWVVEVATQRARRLTGPVLSLAMADPPAWRSDSRTL
ncbi:MAG: hypothetical protein PVF27_04885, partial [Gemmatimonadales bacterium]